MPLRRSATRLEFTSPLHHDKAGTVSNVPFNHFSILKSFEDNFRVSSYLGYAGQPGLISFFGSARSDIQTVDDGR